MALELERKFYPSDLFGEVPEAIVGFDDDDQNEEPEEKKNFWQRIILLCKDPGAIRATLSLSFMICGCHNFSGFPVLLVYSTNLYSKIGMEEITSGYLTIGLYITMMITAFCLGFLLDKFRMKSLVISTLSIRGFCCILIAIFGLFEIRILHIITIALTFTYMISSMLGSFQLPMTIATCSLDVEFRAIAQSMIMFWAWASGFVVTLIYPFMEEAIGSFSFLVFGVAALVWSVYIYFRIVEPKDKSFEEIKILYGEKKWLL